MYLNDPVLTIRIETEHDHAFVEQLYRSTRDDLLHLALPAPIMDDLIGMQFRAQESGYRRQFPNAEHAIVEIDKAPIGRMVTHTSDDAIRLVYIALLPHARNLGHGRTIIRSLQTLAADANKPLRLSVAIHNEHAKHLYLSLGFRVIRDDGGHQEMEI